MTNEVDVLRVWQRCSGLHRRSRLNNQPPPLLPPLKPGSEETRARIPRPAKSRESAVGKGVGDGGSDLLHGEATAATSG